MSVIGIKYIQEILKLLFFNIYFISLTLKHKIILEHYVIYLREIKIFFFLNKANIMNWNFVRFNKLNAHVPIF